MAQFQPTRWFISFIGTGFLLAAMVVIGCGEGEPEFGGERPDGTIEHPVADSIPHFDRDHVPINREQGIDAMEDPPEPISALSAYLSDPEGQTPDDLGLLVNSTASFEVAAVDTRRLVVLDPPENRLLEYDLVAGEEELLAKEGEGPGDLQFVQDMTYRDHTIYVARGDQRISTFDCEVSPCEFDRQKSLDFAALSVAPAHDEALAVLGEPTFGQGESPPELENEEKEPVRVIDQDAAAQRSFGVTYPVDNFLVRNWFLRSAMVRHVPEANRFVFAFAPLPHLYVFDKAGALQSTYEVESFIYQMVQQTDRGARRQVPDQEWSKIRDVRAVEGAILLVRARTHQNPREVGGEGTEAAPTQWGYDIREDYYAVDISNEESYHVGSHAYEGPPTEAVFITDLGLVINEAGELSLVAD